MFRNAPAPIKGNNSFLLSLGLVNIPLAVLTGVESTRVARQEFVVGTDHAVGRTAFDKTTGLNIDQASIVRMAATSTGEFVELTDEEIEAATMPKGVAEVVSFVPVSKLHNAYVTEKVDQVRAKTSGLKAAQAQAAERAFGLFLAGLKARKVVALIKVALRGPARYAAITADGDMLLLFPSDAIRQPKPLAACKATAQELSLMGQLIDSYPQGTPVINDETAAAVQAFVDSKATGKAQTLAAPNMIGADDDLFGALTASIVAKQVTA